MKVLLIWPNSLNEVLGWGDCGAIAEPLALEYLAAGLKLDGHEVRLLDLRLHPTLLDATLREFQPALVGVTAYSMHVRRALDVCRRTRELLPECRTVVGGHHATFLPEDFFDPAVDFVITGEGVGPVRALARALEAGQAPARVPSLWYRLGGGDGFVQSNEAAALELDELVAPDRSITAPDRDRYFIDWMKPVALIRSTAGCPYRCTFCSVWRFTDGKYLVREVDRVVDELREIREDWVFLVDDEAFINGPRMLAMAQALKAAGIHKRFFAYCRIDTLLRQRDVLEAWRAQGLERLFVGIDAISAKDLTLYNKRCTIPQIEEGLRAAQDLGIEIFAQFVVNPDYSRRDFQQLVRFIEHHRIRYPSFTVLTPLPGTDLLRTFDAVTERQPNGRPNWDLFDCQNAVTETRLPKQEFRREYRNLFRVFKGAYTQYREHNLLIDEENLTVRSVV